MKTKVDAFIFDLDGTLVNSSEDLAQSSNVVREHFGMERLSLPAVLSYVGDGLTNLVERLLGEEALEKKEEALKVFRNHYKDHCIDHTRPYPQVVETLEYFLGKPMAVVTNKPEGFSRQILKTLNLEKYFSCLLGGDSTPLKKPDPMPLREALKQLGVASQKVVMVGDGSPDILSGKGVGIFTCAVTYGMRTKSDLEPLNPDFWMDSFGELREIFE